MRDDAVENHSAFFFEHGYLEPHAHLTGRNVALPARPNHSVPVAHQVSVSCIGGRGRVVAITRHRIIEEHETKFVSTSNSVVENSPVTLGQMDTS